MMLCRSHQQKMTVHYFTERTEHFSISLGKSTITQICAWSVYPGSKAIFRVCKIGNVKSSYLSPSLGQECLQVSAASSTSEQTT